MLLELINDILINSSVFYIYFGMFLAVIGLGQLFIIQKSFCKIQQSIKLNDYRSLDVDNSLLEMPFVCHEIFVNWFVKTFKRTDKPSTNEEDESNSYFIWICKIRGGLLWRKTAYSHPFGNIVLLF
ncbi:hypothetical protein SPD48_11220 [Pseudogracilibacillus sp. SE30717A]|uniref:hypothetical protein n=1 Tax=Pseudogracilibacillus sp. SE30717A TaxID=3098293 RepID=UPI00300E305F